ncbi:MAG: DUF434 domain-containing protein [Bacteroidetes bacterium SW_11_64_17]|nr:MAG: DUF434 domain-containing protein [Bacteroidetes bacterium SW_11_64_17]
MPSNRGPHPEDPEQFGPDQYERLRAAVRDLSWLRSRGYSSSRPLRCRASSPGSRARCSPGAVAGRELHVDAFNVLITVEAALGGAYLFVGRDTAYRDVDPLKGTYRIVQQTDPALALLADTLSALDLEGITWHLDDSVSNVGRVKARLRHVASERGLAWRLVQEDDVDATLCDVTAPVVTSDSAILDATTAWLHLEALVHRRHVPSARVVDLRPDGERTSRERGAH